MTDTDASLLRIENLAVSFGTRSDRARAVDGIDLDVAPGEIVALVGESGSGKSLTARAVLGLLPDGARAEGSIVLAGTQVVGADERTLNRLRGGVAAMVFQEPQTALNPVQTIGRQLIEALRLRPGFDKATARDRAVELLRTVEIPDPERRLDWYPHQLSGGQKQRVVIALALSGRPRLIIADEPTTALDVTVQAGILDLLRRLRDETGTAILLITHNLGVVADLADRVVVLRDGNVVEEAGVAELFRTPQASYTKELLAAVPRLSTTDSREAGTPAEDRVVDLEGVSVVHPGRGRAPAFTALEGVSLQLRAGEVLGLVGESGSGKTTIGRVALAVTPPTSGTVRLLGRDPRTLRRAELRALRRDLALVPQDPAASLDPLWTIDDCVAEPLVVHGAGDRARIRRRVAELLDAVHLPAAAGRRRPGELSGGQRQRAALARALALSPRLVVADEPTSALDVSVQSRILELFTQLRAEFGFAALFISHDLAVVSEIADRVALLESGRIVETGPARTVFGSPAQDYTRTLVAAVPVPDPAIQRRRHSPSEKETP
ncbi:dipeptide ABC transporter ATP-binding protein [Amycolatopsis tucumanensis]|uniref:ABC transporter ATP-binding protein n=1 Tax=Amycolatopsis tucumanensis TaxID=401106 RepID=A0ABP7HLL6_9PSEU|nr:ABC transporter ATP-binding protein [Amycolatopsis tucumanensis]MCF6425380.1 ABC transporter ATP-binding protein [Amycolatopsis tucumanensis]